MKSYSKIFKASNLSISDDVKLITPPTRPFELKDKLVLEEHKQEGKETENVVEHQIRLQEAREKAQEIVEQAEQKARLMEEAASEKISLWWQENQKKHEALSLEASHEGYREGFAQGKQAAEAEIQNQYQDKMDQVQQLLEQAYSQKADIIAEAEPFLLELSTAIASQIIKQELESSPDKLIELIKQHILRFKDKEFITVCVHPDDFDFIQGQQSHLVAVVNGETEIKIIPDHTVTPNGCMVRTAYGSIDARIDTQIEEIKKVLLEARRGLHSDTHS